MEESLEKSLDKRKALELQLDHGNDEEIKLKINKIDSEIDSLQKTGAIDSFEREKDHEVKSELYKHSLNISNKLLNTTIIYYPLLSFDLFLKNNTSNRIVEVSYNPLTLEMKEIFCDCCNKKVEELLLDGAGHLICRDCIKKCGNCNEIHCEKCLIKECSLCGKKICIDCAVRCESCRKDFCKNHTRKDSLTGKDLCMNCAVRCESCGEFFKKNISSKKQICEKCKVKEIQKKTLKNIFN